MNTPRYRRLAFERLESKSSPSSLLVLLATTADDFDAAEFGAVEATECGTMSDAALERGFASGPRVRDSGTAEYDGESRANDARANDAEEVAIPLASKWRLDHSPRQLLMFMASETSFHRGDLEEVARPTSDQCDAADMMMRLDDDILRAMITRSDSL